MRPEDPNDSDGMFSSSSYQEYALKCAVRGTEPAEEPIWKIAKAIHDQLLNRPNDTIPEYCIPDPSYVSLADDDLTAGFARTEWNFDAGPHPYRQHAVPVPARHTVYGQPGTGR